MQPVGKDGPVSAPVPVPVSDRAPDRAPDRATAPERGRPAGVLRVASYNVRDLKDDPAAAARVVRAIAPDALCLQEVPRHPLAGHRVAGFANACGMLFAGGHTGSGGTTVLTSLRAEVAASTHHRLPVRRFDRSRGYAIARVALPGRPSVLVASAHLSLDADERARHAAAILAHLRSVGSGEGGVGQGAVVLGADLNESADGSAWQAVAAVLTPVTGAAATFPARAPRRRIDVIFAGSALRPVAGAAVLLPTEDLAVATDHLPVWADLELVPEAV